MPCAVAACPFSYQCAKPRSSLETRSPKIDEACIAVLAGYYLPLRVLGSSHSTTAGEEIQVGGQKIIAYTAVLAVFARSLLVRSHIRQLVPAFTT